MLRHLLRSILTSVYQKVKKMIFKKADLKRFIPERITQLNEKIVLPEKSGQR